MPITTGAEFTSAFPITRLSISGRGSHAKATRQSSSASASLRNRIVSGTPIRYPE